MEPPAPFQPQPNKPGGDSIDRANAANICFYCRQRDGKEVPATTTVHDKRGCMRVCASHAAWRETTSKAFGHHANCPDGPKA